jgi:uncharacterized membrane protein YgcG
MLEQHLKGLNILFFAPRFIASRLNLISPAYYAKLDPFARGEAVTAARNMVALMGSVMVAAKMAGASVEFDPRSSNFGKIKVGNTRIDITGGFSQQIRFLAQEMSREVISSAGSHQHIATPFDNSAGPGITNDLTNVTKLLRSKAAPIPGMAWDIGSHKNFIGQPVTALGELGQNAPFLAQDIYDARQTKAPTSRVFAAAFLSAIGFGVQSYKDKTSSGSGSGGSFSNGGYGGTGGGDYGSSGGYDSGSGGFSNGGGSFSSSP